MGGTGGLLWVRKNTSPDAGRFLAAYDGNGIVTALYSETGAIVARYEYGPFGEALNVTATHSVGGASPWHWSTKRTDSTTDLVHYEYRVYDPGARRWPNRDPLGERGGRNFYGFVGNPPTYRYDRLGKALFRMQTIECLKGWHFPFMGCLRCDPRAVRSGVFDQESETVITVNPPGVPAKRCYTLFCGRIFAELGA